MSTKTEPFIYEEDLQKCLEVMREEHKVSTSLFQRRLRLGYTRAAAIITEMEKRGYVQQIEGESGAAPRKILSYGNESTPSPASSTSLEPSAEEMIDWLETQRVNIDGYQHYPEPGVNTSTLRAAIADAMRREGR